MQQLSLQFEGYADEQYLSTQSSAKQSSLTLENSLTGNKTFPSLGISRRCLKACELSVGWALRQSNPSAALQKVINNVKLLAEATAACAFAFGLMFFAALIG